MSIIAGSSSSVLAALHHRRVPRYFNELNAAQREMMQQQGSPKRRSTRRSTRGPMQTPMIEALHGFRRHVRFRRRGVRDHRDLDPRACETRQVTEETDSQRSNGANGAKRRCRPTGLARQVDARAQKHKQLGLLVPLCSGSHVNLRRRRLPRRAFRFSPCFVPGVNPLSPSPPPTENRHPHELAAPGSSATRCGRSGRAAG